MSYVVELYASLGHLRFASGLPLQHSGVGEGLGCSCVVHKVIVVALIEYGGNEELHLEYVHSDLGHKVKSFEEHLLGGCALDAGAAISHGRLMTVFYPFDILHGDIFAVHSGEQPTATVLAQKFVYRHQNGSGIVSCDDAAFGGGIDIQNIVENNVFCIGNVKSEVLHQS